jgi:lipopolysaccharide transport system permease protein
MSDVIILEAGRQERHYWRDLWSYRELFGVLALRDLSVRYKQTAVFGRIAKLPSDGGAPYPLMVFAGMLPWTLFATGLAEALNSLINNSQLISKVYFPRPIIPIATVVVSFVDFLISFVILILLMLWYWFLPSWRMLFLPVFVVFTLLTSIGPSLGIAALNVKYRATFGTSCHSSFNLVFTFPRWVFPQALCPSSGGCCTPLTRWLELSMVFAGASWVDRPRFIFPVWR